MTPTPEVRAVLLRAAGVEISAKLREAAGGCDE